MNGLRQSQQKYKQMQMPHSIPSKDSNNHLMLCGHLISRPLTSVPAAVQPSSRLFIPQFCLIRVFHLFRTSTLLSKTITKAIPPHSNMYPTSKPKLSPSFIPKQTPAKLSYYDTTKQASAKPSYHNVAKQTSIETLSSNQTAVYYNVTTKTFWPSNPIRSITPSYTTKAFEEPVALTSPQRLLVILDLNGTLFYRAERNNRAITQRPHLKQFLDYLFQNCQVMVWSSSQEHSVERMLSHGFGSYVTKLDRIWNRSHFRLPKVDFDRKTLTLKDLEFVWEAIKKDKSQSIKFDQTNTVLIDDSKDKIMLQRYNGLTLKDFDHAAVQAGNDNELLKVVKYLEKLVMQKNVSAYMRLHPFDLEEKAVAKALNSGKKGTLDDSIDKLARQLGNSTL